MLYYPGPPVQLTADMRAVVLEQRLGYHATVSPDGRPNLSPKGTTTVFDDEHLIFAHIRSPQTVANLRANPAIETNVVDPILRRGYRFRGRGAVYEAGEMYERGLAILAEHGYNADPERIRAVVLITVEEALELRSPAYDDGSSTEEVAAPWRARFRRRLWDEMADQPSAAAGPGANGLERERSQVMEIAVLVFDGVDELDALGPYEVFSNAILSGADASVRLVAIEDRDEIQGAHGLVFHPQGTLGRPDVLIVPGGGWNERSGNGAWHEAQVGMLPRRLAELHGDGVLLGAVCTGGMLVAEAGLLRGRPAVTHGGALEELRERGAEVVDARVVDDGEIVTAGGVTSGLDLALHLVERLFGADIKDAVEVELEYRGALADTP